MPRILWFAIGVLAGTAYSSSLIHRERLDRAPGEAALDIEEPELRDAAADQRAMKEKIADRIEEGAIRISGFLEEKAHMLSDVLRGTSAPPLDVSATAPAQTPTYVGATMAAPTTSAPIDVATTFAPAPEGGGGGTTAHEVLEADFPQIDPSRPSEPILFDPAHKPPVMLDVTADQGGMENLR